MSENTDDPNRLHAIVVDDLFLNYDVLYDDAESLVYADCTRCDEIVSTMEYDEIAGLDEMDLYERIVEDHRKI